jgi:hypothetical protein
MVSTLGRRKTNFYLTFFILAESLQKKFFLTQSFTANLDTKQCRFFYDQEIRIAKCKKSPLKDFLQCR